jgi:hypothetical protein
LTKKQQFGKSYNLATLPGRALFSGFAIGQTNRQQSPKMAINYALANSAVGMIWPEAAAAGAHEKTAPSLACAAATAAAAANAVKGVAIKN